MIESTVRAMVIAAVVTFLLPACSPSTVAVIAIDVDSFLESESRVASVDVPTTNGVSIYVLPGLQVDDLGTGPDSEMGRGSVLDIPELPGESQLRVRVSARVDVENRSGTTGLSATFVDVVLAAESSTDIYADGVSIGQGSLASVPANGSGTVEFISIVEEGDPAYSILASGTSRIGVTTQIDQSVGTTVPALIEIVEVEIEISFRLYSLFRLL